MMGRMREAKVWTESCAGEFNSIIGRMRESAVTKKNTASTAPIKHLLQADLVLQDPSAQPSLQQNSLEQPPFRITHMLR